MFEARKSRSGEYATPWPFFPWITIDPDRAWERPMAHVLHQLRSYSQWTEEAFGRPAGPYAEAVTAESVRQSDAYQVRTPELA